MYGFAEDSVYVMMFTVISLINKGSWKLGCALQGGDVMTMYSVDPECEMLGR